MVCDQARLASIKIGPHFAIVSSHWPERCVRKRPRGRLAKHGVLLPMMSSPQHAIDTGGWLVSVSGVGDLFVEPAAKHRRLRVRHTAAKEREVEPNVQSVNKVPLWLFCFVWIVSEYLLEAFIRAEPRGTRDVLLCGWLEVVCQPVRQWTRTSTTFVQLHCTAILSATLVCGAFVSLSAYAHHNSARIMLSSSAELPIDIKAFQVSWFCQTFVLITVSPYVSSRLSLWVKSERRNTAT